MRLTAASSVVNKFLSRQSFGIFVSDIKKERNEFKCMLSSLTLSNDAYVISSPSLPKTNLIKKFEQRIKLSEQNKYSDRTHV